MMTSIQIVSVGHSGSSILNLVLGEHPLLFSVGEIWSVEEFWENDICACGKKLNTCPFWTKNLKKNNPNLLGSSLRKGSFARRKGTFLLNITDILILIGSKKLINLYSYLSTNMQQTIIAAENNLNLLKQVSLINKSIVVDSSKNPIRAKLLSILDKKTKIIYLVRDGRGASLSWSKAYGYKFKKSVLQWMMRDLLIKLFLLNVRGKNKLMLKYEDFSQHPEETCRKICDFLKISYNQDMLIPQKKVRHDVHINPNSLKKRAAIKLDDKWKNELSRAQLKLFNRMAGVYNYFNGYIE